MRRILIIDDEEDLREVAALSLEAAAGSTVTEDVPDEARAKLKFCFAETLEDVLKLALVPEPKTSVELPAQFAVVS